MRILRNGISHCNVEFIAVQHSDVCGIRVRNKHDGKKNWEVELSVAELKSIAFNFLELIEKQNELNGGQ